MTTSKIEWLIDGGKEMRIEDIFQDKGFQIPIKFQTDDFTTEVESLLDGYINKLKFAGLSMDKIDQLQTFRDECLTCLSYYLKGIHSEAFSHFETAINSLKINNSDLLYSKLEDQLLFRGRVNKGSNDFSNDEMYHIPLNKRRIISTQRYSFPGLPCIYAGASVYTCWVELGRPSFDEFQVATLWCADSIKDLKVIDLSNIPQQIDSILNKLKVDIEEYCLYWPLLAVCSIKTYADESSFKPEYILPQFVLEYILKTNNSDKIVGIKYVSNKVAEICEKQMCDDWHLYVNYVFPSRSDSMSEVNCNILYSQFQVENNSSGKELQVLTRILEIDNAKIYCPDEDESVNSVRAADEIVIGNLSNRKLYTHDGKSLSYAVSVFGMIERALQRKDFDDLEDEIVEFRPISIDEFM